MAPETKNKKRKSGATIPSPSTKKLKKTEAAAPVETTRQTRSSAAPKVEPEPTASTATKSKASRKRASDFFDGNEETAAAAPAVETKPTKSKKAKKAADAEDVAPAVKAVNGKEKKTKKAKVVEKEPSPVPEEEEELVAEEVEDESDEEEDDQTAALLKGFESDDDDEADGEEQAIEVDKLPALPNEKKLRKKLDKASGESNEGPGVVYVGRIPHGFYEHQMRAYFSQFGNITRLRLSRNKKTGRSRHYAFIEFQHASVAAIVAETMDKYLMFGHILQVRLIPREQVHEQLFKGANKRFKPAPRNKIEGRRLRLALDREGWEKRISREEQRRKQKDEKLRALGYDFEAPGLKSVEDVPRKDKALPAAAAAADEAEEQTKAITETAHEETDEQVKDVVVQQEPGSITVMEKTSKKPKRKSGGAVETEKEVKVKVTSTTKAKKGKETAKPAAVKKSKKSKA